MLCSPSFICFFFLCLPLLSCVRKKTFFYFLVLSELGVTSSQDMSSSMDVGWEKVCYIPCNFCNITLAVSVPFNNLMDMVTVRCGHCTHLWSVNMAAALHSISSWPQIQAPNFPSPDYRFDSPSSSRCNKANFYHPESAINKNEGRISANRNPEKRQRVPSAYNQFIKEEIQRIKANNPTISHREAFSTAAKNWAHFPHIHFGLMLDTNDQQK